MSYVWFQSVLAALGKKLNYESISNIYGNSFAKDPQKVVNDCNPLIKKGVHGGASIMQFAKGITVVESTGNSEKGKEDAIAAAEATLGDISWAKELLE